MFLDVNFDVYLRLQMTLLLLLLLLESASGDAGRGWETLGDAGRDREERYFFVNPSYPLALTFLLFMPLSIALPTLAPVNGRSFGILKDPEVRAEDLYWDPAYIGSLSRLSTYFDHLELPVLSCQERLICELTADPDTFFPISQIFMKEIRLTKGPVNTTTDCLMFRYVSAAGAGLISPREKCASTYPRCQLPAVRVINMAVLRLWQFLSAKFNIHLA
ncbi:uncharacterized protein [Cherax quadricarinatus]|uniref:uncharacterized protein n=1 Tax=Cherax quadricarinatus TaxID=27406 RepID=UPI00387EA624